MLASLELVRAVRSKTLQRSQNLSMDCRKDSFLAGWPGAIEEQLSSCLGQSIESNSSIDELGGGKASECW
jgi:hypothetical protein